MQIGPYKLNNRLVLAPMAGVTDQPFRLLCRELGAGLVVSEMVTSNPALFNTRKTQLRLRHDGEAEPIAVQIAGATPEFMAEAARFNVKNGAQIIDINMGCPAKKVCNVMAGSALMQNESLVASILNAVVGAVNVPVTLKIRTGWNKENKNALSVAKIAEDSGIQALTVHGRTRACAFRGYAEHDTVAEIKSRIKIPIIANGDIATVEQAKHVLSITNVDGLMIGRAAQGNPWIFREIQHYLKTGEKLELPSVEERLNTLLNHIKNLYDFYGEYSGIRIARKHINWYCKSLKDSKDFTAMVNKADTTEQQTRIITNFFQGILKQELAA